MSSKKRARVEEEGEACEEMSGNEREAAPRKGLAQRARELVKKAKFTGGVDSAKSRAAAAGGGGPFTGLSQDLGALGVNASSRTVAATTTTTSTPSMRLVGEQETMSMALLKEVFQTSDKTAVRQLIEPTFKLLVGCGCFTVGLLLKIKSKEELRTDVKKGRQELKPFAIAALWDFIDAQQRLRQPAQSNEGKRSVSSLPLTWKLTRSEPSSQWRSSSRRFCSARNRGFELVDATSLSRHPCSIHPWLVC